MYINDAVGIDKDKRSNRDTSVIEIWYKQKTIKKQNNKNKFAFDTNVIYKRNICTVIIDDSPSSDRVRYICHWGSVK